MMRVQLYEWLRVKDDTQNQIKTYISTIRSTERLEMKVKVLSGTNIYFVEYPLQANLVYNTGQISLYGIYRFKVDTSQVLDIYSDGDNISVNGDSYAISGNRRVNIASHNNAFDIQVGEITHGSVHLKPCKLLSPYGIHPAGECCMIDVLSNTLYFNQGSGAFSVEGEVGEVIDTTPVINNIISPLSTKAVRLRECIISNNVNNYGAWIDTNIINSSKVDAEVKFTTRNVLTGRSGLFGNVGKVANTNRFSMSVERDWYGNPICWRGAVPPEVNRYIGIESGTHIVRINKNQMILDDVTIWTNATPREWNDETHLYLCKNADVSTTDLCETASIQYCKIWEDGVLVRNLHPAELALPYGTHQIGEACMINLLNGDLYFNQGSGQFTCEGAVLGYWQDKPMNDHYCDVEGTLHRSVQIFADNGERLKLIWEKNLPFTTHRWLKGDGVAYALVNDYSDNVRFKATISDGNNNYLSFHENDIDRGFIGVINDKQILRFNTDTTSYEIGNIGEEISIANHNNVNGVLLSKNIKYIWRLLGGVNGYKGMINYYNSDTLHLTPAVLDRPTLASEDNNNIARKQGEAVFVDEERYKQGLPWCFGNVASSGSFSVSDYLIKGEDYERVSGVVNSTKSEYIKIPFGMDSDIDISVIPIDNTNTSTNLYPFGVDGYRPNTYYGTWDLRQIADYEEYPSVYQNNVNRFVLANGYLKFSKPDKELTCTQKQAPSVDWFGLFGIRKNNSVVAAYLRIAITTLKVGSTLDLIPVRLLRNIEPTCTHNGKGGKANEIGFFDTISGKFYGNDGQGEFTEYIP